MEDCHYLKEYYKVLFQIERPKDKFDDEWKALHQQAFGFIQDVPNQAIGAFKVSC